MQEEEKRDYVILRWLDGLLLHTRPITLGEALWLSRSAYQGVRDRRSRVRYLEEWGNVMDPRKYMKHYRSVFNPLDLLGSIYKGSDEFTKDVNRLLIHEDLPPEARQILEELAGKIDEFLREPVRPRRIVALSGTSSCPTPTSGSASTTPCGRPIQSPSGTPT